MTDPVDYDRKEAELLDGLTAELTVESDGDRVTSRSVGDIDKALNLIDRRRERAANPARLSGTTVVAFCPE